MIIRHVTDTSDVDRSVHTRRPPGFAHTVAASLDLPPTVRDGIASVASIEVPRAVAAKATRPLSSTCRQANATASAATVFIGPVLSVAAGARVSAG